MELNEEVFSTDIIAELVCIEDTYCDEEWRQPDLETVGCEDGSPIYLDSYSSADHEISQSDEWNVPYRHYTLS